MLSGFEPPFLQIQELELLREKRKSRRHSQILPTLSTSIGAAVSTEVPDTDKRQPLQSPPSTTKVSEVVSSAVNIRAQSVQPESAIAHNQPPKKETPVKKKASLSSITVDTRCVSSSTDIVQNLEEHSILLAKLKSSTKRTDRKTNRQSVNMPFMQAHKKTRSNFLSLSVKCTRLDRSEYF